MSHSNSYIKQYSLNSYQAIKLVQFIDVIFVLNNKKSKNIYKSIYITSHYSRVFEISDYVVTDMSNKYTLNAYLLLT